jgi:nucleotide-binding universal stress UspA family protein
MYSHILVPTDGSPLSRAAVADAVALARALGARVTGLFAAPAPTPIVFRNRLPAGYASPRENEKLIAKAAAAHLAVIQKAADAAGVPCTCVSVKSDFPAEAILAEAKRRKCDLIVMASHGRRGLKGLLLGSETQKVLSGARVPVLVHRKR